MRTAERSLDKVSVAVMNTIAKSYLKKKGFISLCSWVIQSVPEKGRDRDSRQEPEDRMQRPRKCCLLACRP